jgi:AcrR family transcriptional regulator
MNTLASTKPRTRDPEGKRARILDAALTLFAEGGYEATSTSSIAKLAGVSEGTVFHHFGSKQGLLAAVATRYGQLVVQNMFESVATQGPIDVRAMMERLFDFAERHGRIHQVIAMANGPADWGAGVRAFNRVVIAALSEAFRGWNEQGTIRCGRPDIAARLIFSMVDGALYACIEEERGARRAEYIDEVVLCISGALGAEGQR